MPYWNLYLQDQGFNYQQIGILSSIAIVTRFFAPLVWGWIADKSGKRMLLVRLATWMEACIWLAIFIVPNTFQSVALLMLILAFSKMQFWLSLKGNLILVGRPKGKTLWKNSKMGIGRFYCRCVYHRCNFRNYSNLYVAYFITHNSIACIYLGFYDS